MSAVQQSRTISALAGSGMSYITHMFIMYGPFSQQQAGPFTPGIMFDVIYFPFHKPKLHHEQVDRFGSGELEQPKEGCLFWVEYIFYSAVQCQVVRALVLCFERQYSDVFMYIDQLIFHCMINYTLCKVLLFIFDHAHCRLQILYLLYIRYVL